MSSKGKKQTEIVEEASEGRARRTRNQKKAREKEEPQGQLGDKNAKEKAVAKEQIKKRKSAQITDVSPAQEDKQSDPKPKAKTSVLTPAKRANNARKAERKRQKLAQIKEELEKELANATPERKAVILEAENEKKRKMREANQKRRERRWAAETPEQRLARLEARRQKKKSDLQLLTPEERAQRITQITQRRKQRQAQLKEERQKLLANGTPEVKAAILEAKEEAKRKRKEAAQRREDRKLAEETPEQTRERLELLSQRKKECKLKMKEVQKVLTPEQVAAKRAHDAEKARVRYHKVKADLEKQLAVATPEEKESILAQIKENRRLRCAKRRQARQHPNETPEETKARLEARAEQLKKYRRLIEDRQEAGEKSIVAEELRKKLKIPFLTPEMRARRNARYVEWRRKKREQRNEKFANATPEEQAAILEAEKNEFAFIVARKNARLKRQKEELLLKLSRANPEEKTLLLAEEKEKRRLHCMRARESYRRSRARKIEQESSKEREARLAVRRAHYKIHNEKLRRRNETSEQTAMRLELRRLETPEQTTARRARTTELRKQRLAKVMKDLETKLANATPEERAIIIEQKTKQDRRRRANLLAKETPSEATARRATRVNQLQKYIGILQNREVLADGTVIKEEMPYFNQRLSLKQYGEKKKPGSGRITRSSTCQQRAQEALLYQAATSKCFEELKPQVTSDPGEQQNPTDVTIIKEEKNQDTWSYFEATHNYLTQETFQIRDLTSIEDGSEGIGSSIDGLDASSSNLGTLEDFAGPSSMRGLAINDTALGRDPLGYLPTAIKTEKEADEHAVYGEYIANKFRTCNRDESEAFVAKQLIENILTNLFAGAYQGLSTAVVAPESLSAEIPPVLSDALKMEPE